MAITSEPETAERFELGDQAYSKALEAEIIAADPKQIERSLPAFTLTKGFTVTICVAAFTQP